jgi:hypothetical protein
MMKKTLILFLALQLNIALAGPVIKVLNTYTFDFINMTLATQIVPLNNGGYIVQKYGHVIAIFDQNGKFEREIEIAPMTPIYQKGVQLKDGRILFIDSESYMTIYDEKLNKLSEHQIPAEYPWGPCMTENGKLVFGTYRDDQIVIMDKLGNFSSIDEAGIKLKTPVCLANNMATIMSGSGTLSIIDLNKDDAQVVYQDNFKYIDDSFKVINNKINFLTGDAKYIIDPKTLKSEKFYHANLGEFIGVDYFNDGRYVVIASVQDENTRKYYSQIKVYSPHGEKIGSMTEMNTGGTATPEVKIIDDKYILTNHCASSLFLYEFTDQLYERDRIKTPVWLCDSFTDLADGSIATDGYRNGDNTVFQIKIEN